MPRSGAGVHSLVSSPFATAGQIAVAAPINANINDIGAEITDSLSRSGKGGMTANLAMGGNKVTGMATGTAANDAATLAQVQGQASTWAQGAGTADAITAAFTPAVSSLTDGLNLRVRATAANATTTPTFAPDAQTARTIKKLNGAALVVGDIAGAAHDLDLTYVSTGTYWNLNNPAAPVATAATDAVAGITRYSTLAEAAAQAHTTSAVTPLGLKQKPECLAFAVSDELTAITTGAAKLTFRMPYAFTLLAGVAGVKASLTTASTSGIPTVDINEGGVTILSTKLTIDANEKTSVTAAAAPVISDTALAADAEITIDIDVAGTGAKGLKVYMIGHQ